MFLLTLMIVVHGVLVSWICCYLCATLQCTELSGIDLVIAAVLCLVCVCVCVCVCVSMSTAVTSIMGCIVVELCKYGMVRDEMGRIKFITHIKATGFLTITFFALFSHSIGLSVEWLRPKIVEPFTPFLINRLMRLCYKSQILGRQTILYRLVSF